MVCAGLLLCMLFASQPAFADDDTPTETLPAWETVVTELPAPPVATVPPAETPSQEPVVPPVTVPADPPPPAEQPAPVVVPPVEEAPAPQLEEPVVEDVQPDVAPVEEPTPESTPTTTAVATPSASPKATPKETHTAAAVPAEKSAADIHKIVHIKKGSSLPVQLLVIAVLLMLGYGYFRAMRHTRRSPTSRNGK